MIHRELDLRDRPDRVLSRPLVTNIAGPGAHLIYDLHDPNCAPISRRCSSTEATVEWPERLSPFVTLDGTRSRQDISGNENFEKTVRSRSTVAGTEEHRHLGNHERATNLQASASAEDRQPDDPIHQPQTAARGVLRAADPGGPDKTLGSPKK